MKTAFVYKTAFTNGRIDFMDLVVGDDAADAEATATDIVRSICDERGCDEWAEVEIVGALAADPATLAEDLSA